MQVSSGSWDQKFIDLECEALISAAVHLRYYATFPNRISLECCARQGSGLVGCSEPACIVREANYAALSFDLADDIILEAFFHRTDVLRQRPR